MKSMAKSTAKAMAKSTVKSMAKSMAKAMVKRTKGIRDMVKNPDMRKNIIKRNGRR